MKRRSRIGLVAVAAPFLGGCSGGYCPSGEVKSTDGLVINYRPDGGISAGSCSAICKDTAILTCEFVDAGLVQCPSLCTGGRLPATGLGVLPVGSPGQWIGRMAELESAAVVAFESLARELDAHGLPKFARAALAAALEEVGHANAVAHLALGFGVAPMRRKLEMHAVRSLEDVAIDNAGEGCGRELLGALVNQHQAHQARNSGVRQTMAAIAADEMGHARFSFELAEVLMPRLTVAERRRVRQAQERTLTSMVGEELDERDARDLGLMDEGQLKAVVGRLLDTARI